MPSTLIDYDLPFKIAHDFARDHQQTSRQRMKRRYDMPSVPSTFSRGAMVWLHNPQWKKGLSPKLSRPWEGLYVVLDRIIDVVYRIQRSPRARPNVVRRSRLWTYRARLVPISSRISLSNGRRVNSKEAFDNSRPQ